MLEHENSGVETAGSGEFQTAAPPTPHLRPLLHFTPERNWLNDPNGLFYLNGIYHLFYQHNPFDNVWGHMHWGHATSEDLLTWSHRPLALYEEVDGLGAIFSGGAVVDHRNTLRVHEGVHPSVVATFTHHNAEDVQSQSLAFSFDGGVSWEKFAGNPVIPNTGQKDFRDPKVTWLDHESCWIMALAVGDHIEFYSSTNLIDWTLEQMLCLPETKPDGVLECPDLFPLTNQNGKEVWVLLISVNPGAPNGGSATFYLTGDMIGRTFHPVSLEPMWFDYGPDSYACMTWDGRGAAAAGERVGIAWMSNWTYANETPTYPWRGAMTLPRRLTLETIEGQNVVANRPIKAIDERRTLVSNSVTTSVLLPSVCFDVVLECRLDTATSTFVVELINKIGNRLSISVNPTLRELTIDRSCAGWSSDNFNKVARAPISSHVDSLDMRLIMDACSLEIFADGGKTTMTALVFPQEQWTHCNVSDSTFLQSFELFDLS